MTVILWDVLRRFDGVLLSKGRHECRSAVVRSRRGCERGREAAYMQWCWVRFMRLPYSTPPYHNMQQAGCLERSPMGVGLRWRSGRVF